MKKKQVIKEASKVGNFSLLEEPYTRKINPGVISIGIILESYIIIDTWPEHGIAAIDIYTCKRDSNPVKAFEYIAESLDAKVYEIGEIDRSPDIELIKKYKPGK